MEPIKDAEQNPPEKFTLNLHKKPSLFTPNESAAGIGLAAHLADVEKLGLDPTKVHLILEFKDTGHTMCMSLSRGAPKGSCDRKERT